MHSAALPEGADRFCVQGRIIGVRDSCLNLPSLCDVDGVGRQAIELPQCLWNSFLHAIRGECCY